MIRRDSRNPLVGPAMPEMQRFNYVPAFAAGSIGAGATLGILSPPSVILPKWLRS